MRPGKNIRLFQNPFLEQCTYVHPAVPLLLWGPVSAYTFSRGILRGDIDFITSMLLVIAGLFIWSLSEYVLHRWVFHFTPHGALQERVAFLIHGIHHEDPQDERRLLMPPAAAIFIASLFYALFYGVLGSVNANPFFAGFILGYLAYDYTHFAVHFWNPKSQLLKKLKQNHMKHHFVTPDARYGVSNMFWDKIFGTRG